MIENSNTISHLPDAQIDREQFLLPIHTYSAVRLVKGRPPGTKTHGTPQSPIVGLFTFESLVRPIWSAALHDNPYAAWYLQRIRKLLEEAQNDINKRFKVVEEQLATRDLEIETFPLNDVIDEFEVNVHTPPSIAVSDLIIDIDVLGAAMLFLYRAELMDKESFDKATAAIAHLGRRVMTEPSEYKHFLLTRDDVRTGTNETPNAEQAMGPVPQAILDLPNGTAWSGPIVL